MRHIKKNLLTTLSITAGSDITSPLESLILAIPLPFEFLTSMIDFMTVHSRFMLLLFD